MRKGIRGSDGTGNESGIIERELGWSGGWVGGSSGSGIKRRSRKRYCVKVRLTYRRIIR